MRREAALARFALVMLLAPALSSAQPFADLQCQKIKADFKVKGLVDIAALQAEIPPSSGCTLRGPALMCVPVEGHNARVEPPPLPAGAPPGKQEIDFVCYRARCKGSPLPDGLTVTDRFGTYALSFKKTSLICAPALQGGPEACGESDAPQCGGACPVGRSCISEPGTCSCVSFTCSSDSFCSVLCGGTCDFVPFCRCQ